MKIFPPHPYFALSVWVVLLNESIPLASLTPFTDAAYCSLSFSLRCGDAVCGQRGRASFSLKRRWLHFSTSDKNNQTPSNKIKLQKTKPCEFYRCIYLQIKVNLQRHLCTDFEEMNTVVFPLSLVSATALFIVCWETDLWSSLEIRLPRWCKSRTTQKRFTPTKRDMFWNKRNT